MKRVRWKVFAVVAALGAVAWALPGAANGCPRGPAVQAEGARTVSQEVAVEENVVTVRGDSLPAAIQLKIFAEHLLAMSRVKLAAGEAGLSSIRLFLQGTGLERLDSRTLAAAVARDDEFMTDQRARWEEERRRAKLAGRDRLFEGVSDGFTMERAEFIGGTLGRWLHEEHLTPKQAGFVLRNVLHLRGPSGSVFSAGGDGPSYEDFEKEARQFETAFEREFGTPLPALIQEKEEERR